MAKWTAHIPPVEFRAAIVSMSVGVSLLIVKFIAVYETGSSVIFADALESIVNVAASSFAAYALTLAHRPADKDHPYGHGKVEFMSAGFEGGMILIAAVVALARAVQSLFPHHARIVDHIQLGVMLMLIALVINSLAGLYLIRVGKTRASLALEADGRHLMTDAATSAIALLALLIVRWTGIERVDSIGAIIVSMFIGWTGIGLLRRSVAGLMDEQDSTDSTTLRNILDAHTGASAALPKICSYHKLRHRHTGRYHWVDFHIVLPRNLTIEHGHEVASAIEYEIEQALGEGNATAHIEPCVDPDCASCQAAPSNESLSA